MGRVEKKRLLRDVDGIFQGREVKISMEKFLRDVISEFPKEISKTTQTPASAHLF